MTRNPLICAGTAAALAIALCAVAFAGLGFWLWPTAKRIDSASAALLICRYHDAAGNWRGNPNCVQSLFQSIGGSVRTSAGAVAKAAPEISTSLRAAAAESVNTSKKTSELVDESKGAVQDLRKLLAEQIPPVLSELKSAISSLNTEIVEQGKLLRKIEGSADQSVQAATGTLQALTGLETKLADEIDRLDPKAQQTLDAMLALVQSEHWQNTLANIDKGTKHGAEIAESIDTATRGLRQKAALVKSILLKIAGMVKMTFSPF